MYLYNPKNGSCDVILSKTHDINRVGNDIAYDGSLLGPPGSFKCVFLNSFGLIVGGDDGIVRVLFYTGLSIQIFNVTNGAAISEMALSDDFKQLAITSQHQIHVLDLAKEKNYLVT